MPPLGFRPAFVGASTAGGAWDLDTDFSSDLGWQKTGADVTYDFTTNNRADYNFDRDGTEDRGYFDLQDADALNGSNADDTAWVYRWRQQQTSEIAGYHQYYGITDSNTIAFNTAQDAIGLFNEAALLAHGYSDAASLTANTVSMGDPGTTWTYYFEMIRTSATGSSVERFSDAWTTSIDSFTNTPLSTVQSLRYLTWIKRSLSDTTAETIGHWDDVKFADGVTVAP